MKTVYLDNNATTAIDSRVLKNLQSYLMDVYGNSSSHHNEGRRAAELLARSRTRIARSINAQENEIIFTGTGTESDNMALRGYMSKFTPSQAHLIVSAVEHPAVLNTAKAIQGEGYSVDFAPVEGNGIVNTDKLESMICEKTKLISVMAANNETGALQPVEEIGALADSKGIAFHTDAVQVMGKLPLDVNQVKCSMLSASAHKFYGPKGVGFLYLRKGIRIKPVLTGGRHENQQRPGTVNVPLIAAMADALEFDIEEMEINRSRISSLRNMLRDGITGSIDNVLINTPDESVYNTLNVSFPGIEGESMLLELDANGICVSTGSACSSDSLDASHVMMAMGRDHLQAHGSLRLSLGKDNTEEEIDYAVRVIEQSIKRIRTISPYK